MSRRTDHRRHGCGLPRRRFLATAAFAAVSPLAAPLIARAQKLGERPIRIVVPFAAGGGVDVFARLLAETLRQKEGLTVIIDNRAGANGTVGGNAVRTAAADATTLLFSAGTHVMAQHVMKEAPYDPLGDFASIARVGEAPMLLILAPSAAPASVAELLAEARKAPGKWTWATSALGAPGHLAELEFNRLAGLDLPVVPYRGTAPAMNDVAGGHVQLMIDPVVALLPLAVARKVKGLAVTTAKRTALAPDFPTVAESGLAGMDHSSWYGVWGPKALPADLVGLLNATINTAIAGFRADGQFAKLGIEPVIETPAAFEAFARSYASRNAELLKAAKFERQ